MSFVKLCVLMCVCAFMHVCLASADVGVLANLHRLSECSVASAGWQVDMQCRQDVMPFPSGEMPISSPPSHTQTHTHTHTHTHTLIHIMHMDTISSYSPGLWPAYSGCLGLVSLTDLTVSGCLNPAVSEPLPPLPWGSHGGHSLCLERHVEKQSQYQIKAVWHKEGGVLFIMSQSLF